MKTIYSLLLFICVVCLAIPAVAGVRARYLESSGSTFTIQLDVTRPVPAASIIIQRFPSGVRLLSADPAPADVDPRKGSARWFFKNIRPGTRHITMQLSRPVSRSALSGSIRYRQPGTGKMVRVTIR